METGGQFAQIANRKSRFDMTLIDSIRKNLATLPVQTIEPGDRVHSSVAMLLKQGSEGLEVLMIERARNEKDFWSGHIGLPGGRLEPADSGPRQAAERETREELGLELATAEFWGRLPDIVPGGLSIVVSCFVYFLSETPQLQPDVNEVADAFWFPLLKGLQPEFFTTVEYRLRGRTRTFPAVKVHQDKEQPLWGITYRLLKNLKRVAEHRS